MARGHLSSLLPQISAFLVDKVLLTSVKHVTSEILQELYRTLFALSTDKQLYDSAPRIAPANWFRLIERAQKVKVSMTVDEFVELYREEMDDHIRPQNVSPQLIERLVKLADIVKSMTVWRAPTRQNFTTSPEAVKDLGGDVLTASEAPETEKQKDVKVQVEAEARLLFKGEKDKLTSQDTDKDTDTEKPKTILKYFAMCKDILWFHEREGIKDKVVTRPMALIESMRTLINHKIWV